ncbi:MAG: putative glycoside hydrolase [Ruminococcus sp.]|nr:putative glycoside hydrolase [Ruminococcus sp.]
MAGRKVYRTRTGRRKQNTAKAFQILVILLLLAALVYLGYILAGPLFKFLNRSDDIKPEGWTPPVSSEVSTAPITKIQDNPSETGGTVFEPTINKSVTGFTLPISSLASKSSLEDAVDDAKANGYTAVVIPLKLPGGALTYKTEAEMAVSTGIVTGTLTASEIAETIIASEMTPVCSINLLEDNTPFANYRGVYKFESDNSRWYDNSPSNGGKPWISPFDTDAQEYLKTIATEAASAGFTEIIFDGLVFPPFRNSDLNYIGTKVKDPARYEALLNVWDIVSNAVTENGGTPFLMMSADSVAQGTAEVLHPDRLGETAAVIKIDVASFPTTIVVNGTETILTDMDVNTRVRFILDICKDKTGSMPIYPYIAGLTQSDVSTAVDTVVEMGYSSYFV